MGREKLYPDDYTLDVKYAALDLIKRVNNLFEALRMPMAPLSSGWRPQAINIKIGGAKRSLHMLGKAVDLADKDGHVKKAVIEHPQLLLEFGLWMEHPDSTPSWCHLDTGIRAHRSPRIFKP